MKKVLPLVALVAGFALLFAGIGFANVPAPPVNQDIGFPDLGELDGQLTEADCRGCHDSGVPDRHHMLFGTTTDINIPVPNPDTDGVGYCSDTTATICTVDGDCPVGEVCYLDDTTLSCLSCHDNDNSGGVITFTVERDCAVCHTGDSPHHETDLAQAGDCVSCHGDLVDNFDDGHYIPTYTPSLVTPGTQSSVCEISGDPCSANDSYCTADVCETGRTECADSGECLEDVCETSREDCVDDSDCDGGTCTTDSAECYVDADCTVSGDTCDDIEACVVDGDVCITEGEVCVRSDTPLAGGCNFCHDAGTTDDVIPIDVVDNHDTHHGAAGSGVFTIPGESRACWTCHTTGDYHSTDIRKCEGCHGPESLHNIVADSDDAGTDIVVGGEAPGFSHVGNQSDCYGCHGFETAGAFSAGPGVPSISGASPKAMVAGTDTQVNLTGVAFTSTLATILYTSNVVLTAADGSETILTPASITQNSLTVTIPAETAAGIYDLQAVKNGEASNPVGISVLPAVVVENTNCSKCLGVMTIEGANFAEMPEGAIDINVTEGGVELDVIEWTDTMIKAAGARCGGDVTVNSVYGSSE